MAQWRKPVQKFNEQTKIRTTIMDRVCKLQEKAKAQQQHGTAMANIAKAIMTQYGQTTSFAIVVCLHSN